jgi:hypothetical protein
MEWQLMNVCFAERSPLPLDTCSPLVLDICSPLLAEVRDLLKLPSVPFVSTRVLSWGLERQLTGCFGASSGNL